MMPSRWRWHHFYIYDKYCCYNKRNDDLSCVLFNCFSINHFESSVWHKGLWNADALCCLVVFKDGGNNARKGKSGTIEGVTELHLLVSIAVTALEAVCLISVEVADR